MGSKGSKVQGVQGSRGFKVQFNEQPRHQMPARDRDAVRGDLTGRNPIANVERVLWHRLDAARPSRPRMRVGDLTASPDQMRVRPISA
jgi:hypothetical protein